MRISKAEIESYIPQRAPFIMIDNLVEATPEKFITDFRILPDNIFLENEVLREFALIENIAQSCSAGLAIVKKSAGNKTVVILLAQIENMFLLKGENFLNDRKLLECEIKLIGVKA
jgi:3-hydroxyacyl-[acyl-carrier-protein] dehydratase